MSYEYLRDLGDAPNPVPVPVIIGLGLLLLLLPSPAKAECPVWLAIGGPSQHTKGDADDNEKNYGPGIQTCLTDDNKFRLAAQQFRNTHRIDSSVVALVYQPWRLRLFDTVDVAPGVLAGGITGYQTQAIWAAAPVVSFEARYVGVDYVLAREMGGDSAKSGWVHWLNFKVRVR